MKKELQALQRRSFRGWCVVFLYALLWQAGPASGQNTWQVLANESQLATAASLFTTVAAARVNSEVVPYVAFTESGIAKVKRYTNGVWESTGGNVSDGNASYTNIFTDAAGKLYVAYVDVAADNRLAIKTFNTASGAWEALGGNAANLYLSAGSVLNGISQLVSSHNSWMAFDSGNIPYVIYAEMGTSGGSPFVKRFVNGSWETVGGGAIASEKASGVGIAFDNGDTPYIVYAGGTGSTGPIKVFRFLAGQWQAVNVPATLTGGPATSGARHTGITVADDKVYVLYMNGGNSSRATVITYDQASSSWSQVGGTLSGRDATFLTLAHDQRGILYASFVDVISNGSGRSVTRVMRLEPGATAWIEVKNTDVEAGVDEPSQYPSIATGPGNPVYVVYTKANASGIATPNVKWAEGPEESTPPDEVVTTPRQMENLDRGVVAVRTDNNKVYIGWRLLGTDPSGIGFNIYRDKTKINDSPVTGATNFEDNTGSNDRYTVVAVINGEEQAASTSVSVWDRNYLSIPLQVPAGGTTPDGISYTYNANDCSVGDVDGDGQYEIILKWDPSNAKDNAQTGYTGNVYLDAYRLDGQLLWRIDLGRNIRAGAHYTQFIVYDLDGDGKAEVACKTADGTVDGKGNVIGDGAADYRTTSGTVLSGPEFLTIFNGLTGEAMATANYLPERGSVASWGDDWGNRSERYVAAVAYLDGARPSLIMGRGYYTRLVRVAWDWRDGKLTRRWTFDSNTAGNAAYAGQGNHQMTIGDVDGDGKDEIVNGSSAVNDNGKGLYANGLGHGDALHMTDMDPDRPGQEVWQAHEEPSAYGNYGLEFRDAKTGAPIWGVPGNGADIGRAMAADIDPRHKGYEVWGATGGLYNNKGIQISGVTPSMNFGVWWDGDLSRELLDGTNLDKWDYMGNRSARLLSLGDYGAASNNGTKATPALVADILGDWREEMIFRSEDNSKLLLFTTTIPTETRIYTLMHDPQYRVAVAWQNSGYNQPPHPGFYPGTDMEAPPAPNITLAEVARQSQTITFDEPEPRIIGTADFDPGATASSGLPVSYSSSDEAVATIISGKIHITGIGTTVITASQQGNLLWLPADDVSRTLEVKEDPRERQVITFNPLPERRVGNDDLDPGATASSGLPVSYSSSDESVAVITEGKIHLVGRGTVVITASQPGNDAWAPAEDVQQTLVVLDKSKQIITFYAIPAKKLGEKDVDPGATASSGLPVSYSSSNPAVATVENGLIRITGQGTAIITASQDGDDIWDAAVSVTQMLTVESVIDLSVHQAVSPNGDGQNDFLYIDGIELYPDNKVSVYSRSGNRVFSTSRYDNQGNAFAGKNGSGENLPAGTYYYVVEYQADGRSEHRTGYFVLKY